MTRINIPLPLNPPPGLYQAETVDPWSQAGKYGLGWTYFALMLVFLVVAVRIWHWWQDKIRQAIYKEEVEKHYRNLYSLDPNWDRTAEMAGLASGQSEGPTQQLFPETTKDETAFRPKSNFSSVGFVNDTLALFRYIFYRPVPDIAWGKQRFTFSSLAVLACGLVALAFVTLYCFLQQPLYWESIQYGSPPLAIRSGMIAVATTPWIIATSTKANLITLITGIGPERLNVFHRWLGYLCLFLSLVHMVPFYIQPVWEDGGMVVFSALFPPGAIIYGTGIACFVPLAWLCTASLPIIRRKAYELFVVLHVPVAWIYVGMLFWHSKNYLLSWSYLYASIGTYALCGVIRLFNLNWTKPWRFSWLVGEEAAIDIMTENCIKITIPTRMRWQPGQYVYLRMPGISLFENHPFTVASLCTEDFPSEYGEQYRDCVLVFRPFAGFTRKLLETAIEKGPYHTYRAFIDGPYGGMRRDLAAFDTCILIAGGSGITSLMSQLLNLIKRMRDGKAITKRIVVVWSLKRLEAMDWFREELRICRESAPPESVTCKFFVTAAVRPPPPGGGLSHRTPRPLSNLFHDKLDGFVAGIASKRNSAFIAAEAAGDPDKERELRAEQEDRFTSLPQQKYLQAHHIPLPPPGPPPASAARMSMMTHEALRRPEGRDLEAKSARDVRAERHQEADFGRNGNHIDTKVSAAANADDGEFHFPPLRHNNAAPYFKLALPEGRKRNSLFLAPYDGQGDRPSQGSNDSGGEGASGGRGDGNHCKQQKDDEIQPVATTDQTGLRPPELAHLRSDLGSAGARPRPTSTFGPPSGFEFGFPETPTEFQKSLMRFAFPVPHQIDGGWSVEYGRPDLGYMLKEWATGGVDGRGILGRRTAVFVCGPPSMRVGVANTVARLQAEIWGDEVLEEIFLHTENYAL